MPQIHENSCMGHTAQCLFNKKVIYLLHYSGSHDLTTHTLTVKIKHYCGLVVEKLKKKEKKMHAEKETLLQKKSPLKRIGLFIY